MDEKSDVSKESTAKEKVVKEKPAKRSRTKTGTKRASKKTLKVEATVQENVAAKKEPACTVTFQINNIPTNYGDSVYIYGSNEALGSWNTDSEAGKCEYLDYGTWKLRKEFIKGESFEFKVVKKLLDGTILWQDGDNLNCTIASEDEHVDIKWTQN